MISILYLVCVEVHSTTSLLVYYYYSSSFVTELLLPCFRPWWLADTRCGNVSLVSAASQRAASTLDRPRAGTPPTSPASHHASLHESMIIMRHG